jgi:hypothetical protein
LTPIKDEAVTPDMNADSRELAVTARIDALVAYIETLQTK